VHWAIWEFGRAKDYSALKALGSEAVDRQNLSDWEGLLSLLKAIAGLWQPSRGDASVHALCLINPLQNADTSSLQAELAIAATHNEYAVRIDNWQMRIVPQSLRGYLLMTCATDVARFQRFRRCQNCNEWFPLQRADAKHCSLACRQAAYQANRGVKEDGVA
jgi:hypothetical protein